MAQPIRIRAPTDPTPEEVEEHESTGHVQYRTWCRHCVAGRGAGQQHRTRDEEARSQDGIPMISCDYTFMTVNGEDDGRAKPILVMKDSRTTSVAATFVDAKGSTPYAVKYFSNFLKTLGYKRVLLQSDGEPSIVALKVQAATAAGVEGVPRESPVGDHQGNGQIEQVCKEIKMHIRVGRSALEEKLGQPLGDTDPMLAWMPRHVGDLLNRYRKGRDGKTPEQRRSGKRWGKPAIAFGERLYYRPVGTAERTPLKVGRYIRHHGRTGTLLLMTDSGVVRGQGIRRLSPADQWTTEDLRELRGLTSLGSCSKKASRARRSSDWRSQARSACSCESGFGTTSTEESLHQKRRCEQVWENPGCPGCTCTCVLMDEPTVVPHTEACRVRIMQGDEQGRARLEAHEKEEKARHYGRSSGSSG